MADPQESRPPATTPHRAELRVRFYELDPYDHVNHSATVAYFEVGRVEALASVGMGLDRLKALDTNLVVIGVHTRFLAPAGLGDELMVESGVGEVGRVRAVWLQRIVRGDDVIATQVVTSASTNGAGRPKRFADELIAALEPYALPDDWLGATAPR